MCESPVISKSFGTWKSTLKIVESTLKRVIQTTTLEWIPSNLEWIQL